MASRSELIGGQCWIRIGAIGGNREQPRIDADKRGYEKIGLLIRVIRVNLRLILVNSQERSQQNIRAVHAIFPFREFAWRVACPVHGWDEDHANRAQVRERLPIMSRARCQ